MTRKQYVQNGASIVTTRPLFAIHQESATNVIKRKEKKRASTVLRLGLKFRMRTHSTHLKQRKGCSMKLHVRKNDDEKTVMMMMMMMQVVSLRDRRRARTESI